MSHSDKVVTTQQAEKELDALAAEVKDIHERYRSHSLLVVATMSTKNPEDTTEGAKMIAGLFGCIDHHHWSLARFLVNSLPQVELAKFMYVLEQTTAQRYQQQPAAAVPEEKKEISQEDLLQMPLGKDGRCKN